MDGTLTVPCIDFADMRRRCGVTQGDILDVISSWPAEQQARAYAVIAEIEDEALANMRVMPGAPELCRMCDLAGIPRGLITRNVTRSVDHLHVHSGLPAFQPAISRESRFAYKPSPEALLHICESWGVPPSQVLMVGDSIKDDIVCGNRAGSLTALLDLDGTGNARNAGLSGEQKPTFIVHSLLELQEILASNFTLVPPPQPHAAVVAKT